MYFNVDRFILARQRRRMTSKSLAEKADISPATISRIDQKTNIPNIETVRKIAKALNYPENFFMGDDIESIDSAAVSFRSLSKMTAKERAAALGAGRYGIVLMDWIEERFALPVPDVPNLGEEQSPEAAADFLRQYWAIGLRPIQNIVALMESKGIRFLSLSENTSAVDAFSLWRNETPYVFLNTFKTPERSIFDAAHELGHLVLHQHGGTENRPDAEKEANEFASAFLMPRQDISSRFPRIANSDVIIKAKKRWFVSAFALAYRAKTLNLISDWQYKMICIDLGKKGYRSGEPDGIERLQSVVWKSALGTLWSEKITKQEIADQLALPLDEIEGLTHGLVTDRNEKRVYAPPKFSKPRAIK